MIVHSNQNCQTPSFPGALSSYLHTRSYSRTNLRDHAGHVSTDALVVEDTLDAADSAHGEVLIPQLAGSEVHDVLLGDLADSTLNILSTQAAASGDDLAADVLSNGGGAIERQEDGSLKLGLGTLNLGGGDVVAQARPLAESEVDQVIELSKVLADKVDTPETNIKSAYYRSKT